MLIDFHTHAFPDRLAEGAISGLAKASGYIPETNGTISGTIEVFDKWGVDMGVVQNIAVSPKSERKVNDFAIESNGGRIVAFGSVHPLSENAVSELHRLCENGIKGIKLHPEYQGFNIDDEVAYPIYKTASELGLIVMFHAGWDVAYPESRRAYPERSARVLEKFPDMKVVLAHFGANRAKDETNIFLVGKNVYFDISLVQDFLTPAECADICLRHGIDKILFGTDCPWGNAVKTEEFLRKMPLSNEDKDKIRYKNALRLLGIK